MLVSTYSAIELCPDVLLIDVTCYKEANGVQGGNSHPDNLSGFFSVSQAFLPSLCASVLTYRESQITRVKMTWRS